MTKFTKEQAKAYGKKIIQCNSKSQRDIRLLLMDAYNGAAHVALKLPSFDEYLNFLSDQTSNMEPCTMRRQLKAGLIERALFGRRHVGKMSEGALRVLSENVEPEHHKEVYDRACELMENKKKRPTGAQLREAAQQLNVYKQQESKLKKKAAGGATIIDLTKHKQSISAANPKENTEKPTKKLVKRPADYFLQATSKSQNVEKLKKPLIKAHVRKLVVELGDKDADKLAWMLEWTKDKALYAKFIEIRKTIRKKYWPELIDAIDDELERKKTKKSKKSTSKLKGVNQTSQMLGSPTIARITPDEMFDRQNSHFSTPIFERYTDY